MVPSPSTVQMFSVRTAQTATEEHKPTSSQMPDVRQVKEEVYDTFKQKAGGRVSRAEWWCDTLLKQATVPTLLAVRPWAHVALIAASTEPADCAHYLLLASKKPHAELYEIFIQCVHFSSPFSSLSSFSYSPPWPPSPFLAPPPNRQERLLPAMFFGSTSFLPRSARVSR